MENKLSENETALWNAFRKSNRKAFESLYRSHYAALYHYGHCIISDTEVVQDSIQTLFIDLWRRRKHLGETNHVRPYLYKGMRHLLIKELKSQRKTIVHDTNVVTTQPSREEECIILEKSSHQNEMLQQALRTLSGKQREVVYLRYYENLDNQSIANRMDITVNTVCNLISLALTNLRRLLKNQIDPFLLLLLFLFQL